MNLEVSTQTDKIESQSTEIQELAAVTETVICNHCLRTATNGIKCKGICVADSDY